MAIERTYTINLRPEIMKVPRYKRAKKAVAGVRTFIGKHMKSDDVRIGHALNTKIWENGIRNAPANVKVTATKADSGVVRVDLVGAKEYKQELKAIKAPAEDKKGKDSNVKDATVVKKDVKSDAKALEADIKKELQGAADKAAASVAKKTPAKPAKKAAEKPAVKKEVSEKVEKAPAKDAKK